MSLGHGEPNPRRPRCSICGQRRRIVRTMRRAVPGEQEYDDPDWAMRICDTCDVGG